MCTCFILLLQATTTFNTMSMHGRFSEGDEVWAAIRTVHTRHTHTDCMYVSSTAAGDTRTGRQDVAHAYMQTVVADVCVCACAFMCVCVCHQRIPSHPSHKHTNTSIASTSLHRIHRIHNTPTHPSHPHHSIASIASTTHQHIHSR